jgi:hypothetical protein
MDDYDYDDEMVRDGSAVYVAVSEEMRPRVTQRQPSLFDVSRDGARA